MVHDFKLENLLLLTDIDRSNKYNIARQEYKTNIQNQLVFFFFLHKFN